MPNNPDQILEATEGFVCDLDGERFVVQTMITRVHASHKLAKAYPTRFRPIEDDLSYVDDATTTNEPGQVAGRSRITRQKAVHHDPEAETVREPTKATAKATATKE